MSRERFQRECRNWVRRHPLEVEICGNVFPAPGRPGTGSGSGGGFGSIPGSPPIAGQFAAGGGTSATDQQAGAGTAGIGNLLPWLYPTADFKNVDKFGSVALPAAGSWADVLVFNVEPGRCLKLTQLGIDFVANGGTNFIQGIVPAQLRFFIGTNGSPTNPTRSGQPFTDYSPPNFVFLPGAVSAPTPINGVMVRERQEVRVAVFNVSVGQSTQFVAARILAYSFSKKYWSKLMGPQ